MSEQDIFIGREKELQMIDEMISDCTGAKHVLPIVGKGGIGKTWLLREIYRRCQQDPKVIVIRIDYGEARFQNFPSLARYFIEKFSDHVSETQREEFYHQLSNLESGLETSPNIMHEKEYRTYISGINMINSEVSKYKRIVILSDTAEVTNFPEFRLRRMNSVASNFDNTIVIVAGRNTENMRKRFAMYPDIYKSWHVHGIYDLESFSNSETVQYFEAALEGEMPPDLRDKIFLLTGGNPVLIAIAAEWLTRHIALPEDIDLPLCELQALDDSALAKRRQRFEFALVDKVRSLRKPVDWATLYLAYLNRRYDPKILRLTLELGLDEAKFAEMTEELKTYVFVRKSMSAEGGLLHDEAQRLIMEHVWPIADPLSRLRRGLAQKVIDGYYLPEIERLSQIVQSKLALSVEHKLAAPERRRLPPIPDEDWLKRELQIECLDYHFRISAGKGWQYLNQLFDEALNYRYSIIQMDAIVQAVHNLAPRQVDSARFKVRVAETLLAKGELNNATTMAETVLNEAEVSPVNAAAALIVLGHATTNPTSKINLLRAALDKARLAQEHALEAEGLKRLGLAYRRQGRWTEAATVYRQVLRLVDQQQEPNQYANTLNNLAFVTMLSGYPMRADSMAEKALHIRKAQGDLYGLCLSYGTKGRIAEALGDNTQAGRYHRTSFELAQSAGDGKNIALSQANVAAVERRAHNFEKARQLLTNSLENPHPRVRARVFHEAAKIDRDETKVLRRLGASKEQLLAKYSSAVKNAGQALVFAREIGDKHQIASILLDLALLTSFKEEREDKEHLAELREILKEHNYTLEKGRLTELMGDLAYVQQDLPFAFERYLDACQILARYSPASFLQTFRRVRAKFLEVSPEMQAQICQMIEVKFATVHPASPLAALQGLCADDLADFYALRRR